MTQVMIDDKPFQVYRNCYKALDQHDWQKSYGSAGELLWIDSTCIDQKHDEEKSRQVSVMGDIFAKADSVLACLGRHGDDSELMVDFADTLERTKTFPTGRVTRKAWSTLPKDAHVDISDLAEDIPRLLAAVVAFAKRPYWSRVWIVQELALGRDGACRLLIGHSSISLATMRTMLWVFEACHRDERFLVEHSNHAFTVAVCSSTLRSMMVSST